MTTTYICVGTEVKDRNGCRGIVSSVDKESRLAVIRVHGKYKVESLDNLIFVSYVEVE